MPIYKKVNKNFFKKWTREMAYVLGFFAADGYITVNKRGGQFWCIQITDKKLLKSIKNVIKAEHKISIRIGKGNNKNLYRLQIGSIEMCEDLRSLGFKERKTKNMVVPNVPNKHFSDFIRGYFDGDGNVWVGYTHKKRKTRSLTVRTVFTSCSELFLLSIRNKLESNNIRGGVLVKGKGEYHRLTYSVSSSLNLYNFMYNIRCIKSKLFLTRKKVVFENFLKNKYMRS